MKVYFINAFTVEEFKGNPAAIILVDKEVEEGWMRQMAKQLNQPITTFVMKQEEVFQLRWFTPKSEVGLCGHGTLGAAHIIWSEGLWDIARPIGFETLSGRLVAERLNKSIKLTFPLIESSDIEIIAEMESILGEPILSMAWAKDRYIVELESEEKVRKVIPNLNLLKELDAAGVVVTTSNSTNYDFVSRYFAPKIGVDEDSVTGSAHCALASYWKKRLLKSEFKAYQASERGGELVVRVVENTVELSGTCRTVFKGFMD
ncbi:PhzF family phenazine biosynthesis protein [Cytobacillus suaedae]|nr:PhzF family phenazine biosynthesis protein [Cytobacillus suaedae]